MKYWTKKRIQRTDWKIGVGNSDYPFAVHDPATGKVMAYCYSKVAAAAIIGELKTLGFTEWGV